MPMRICTHRRDHAHVYMKIKSCDSASLLLCACAYSISAYFLCVCAMVIVLVSLCVGVCVFVYRRCDSTC
jgi:hypothetical protein